MQIVVGITSPPRNKAKNYVQDHCGNKSTYQNVFVFRSHEITGWRAMAKRRIAFWNRSNYLKFLITQRVFHKSLKIIGVRPIFILAKYILQEASKIDITQCEWHKIIYILYTVGWRTFLKELIEESTVDCLPNLLKKVSKSFRQPLCF